LCSCNCLVNINHDKEGPCHENIKYEKEGTYQDFGDPIALLGSTYLLVSDVNHLFVACECGISVLVTKTYRTETKLLLPTCLVCTLLLYQRKYHNDCDMLLSLAVVKFTDFRGCMHPFLSNFCQELPSETCLALGIGCSLSKSNQVAIDFEK
jgi:hypothetical protein